MLLIDTLTYLKYSLRLSNLDYYPFKGVDKFYDITKIMFEPDLFDFVIDQDYSTANGKSTERVETTVKVAIDILTIVFIHIIVSHYKAGRRS